VSCVHSRYCWQHWEQYGGSALPRSEFAEFGSPYCRDIINTEPRLDVLINNAGAAGFKNKMTADNLQLVMQVNHFGPFLLTCLLLGKTLPGRQLIIQGQGQGYITTNSQSVSMSWYRAQSRTIDQSLLSP
jgi:NAD(P)-dependent dehydrogenase (short-subunit alcohol dehydrogenase family)